MTRRNLLVAPLVSLLSLSAGPLIAAETALETILVTATRAPQTSARLAQGWSLIDTAENDFVQLQHSNQLFQRVAGAWISRGNGQESLISLRSPVLTGAGSCGSFLTAEDSIALRAPGFCNVNQLFDANLLQAGSVEVLRGPDSGVYGTNAMHGIINVVTRSAEQTENRLQVEAGERDFYRGRLSIADKERGLALNAQASTYGGYQNDSGFEQQKATLRWDGAVNQWETTALVSASHLDQETAGFIRGFEAYRGAERDINPNPEAYRDARSVRAYVRGDRQLSGGRRLSLTLYARDNEMTFLQHFLPWQATEENAHRSIGVQTALTGLVGSTHWQAGIDLDATRGTLLETQDEPFSPNQPAGVHYDYSVDALTLAAYAQFSHDLDDAWSLTGAGRVETTDYRYDNRTGDGSACAPTASACRFFRPADRSDNFLNWTGNLGIIRQLDSHQLYARIARGFRAPQTTELYRLQGGQRVADIDSESVSSIELGSHGLLGEGLSYDVNIYWMDKRDVIFQNADRFNVSGAETLHRGIELEARWAINSMWSADLAASVARHTYASPIDLLGTRVDIDGNVMDTAPRHTGSARLRADFETQGIPLVSELELTWLGEYYLDPANLHRYDGHTLVNLRTNYTVSPTITLSLVLSNLGNSAYAERADFGFGSYRYFVGEPRTALLGVSVAL